MKRTRLIAAGLTATALSIGTAVPALAADPVITTNLGYIPTEGHYGDSFEFMMSGCTVPGAEQTYAGGYLLGPGIDPVIGVEPTDGGNWSVQVEIQDITEVTTHAVCATGPVDGFDDEDIVWISPGYDFTVTDAPQVNSLLATSSTSRTGSRLAVAASTTSGGQALSVDPDALPVLDRMGMPGDEAAALKAEVDANLSSVSQINRLFQTFFGRPASSADLKLWNTIINNTSSRSDADLLANSREVLKIYSTMTGAQFIDAIYLNALGRKPDAATRTALARQLQTKQTTRALVALEVSNLPEVRERFENAGYVVTAYQTIANRPPTPAELDAQLNLLETTLVTRVQIVENVALAVRN